MLQCVHQPVSYIAGIAVLIIARLLKNNNHKEIQNTTAVAGNEAG